MSMSSQGPYTYTWELNRDAMVVEGTPMSSDIVYLKVCVRQSTNTSEEKTNCFPFVSWMLQSHDAAPLILSNTLAAQGIAADRRMVDDIVAYSRLILGGAGICTACNTPSPTRICPTCGATTVLVVRILCHPTQTQFQIEPTRPRTVSSRRSSDIDRARNRGAIQNQNQTQAIAIGSYPVASTPQIQMGMPSAERASATGNQAAFASATATGNQAAFASASAMAASDTNGDIKLVSSTLTASKGGPTQPRNATIRNSTSTSDGWRVTRERESTATSSGWRVTRATETATRTNQS